MTKVIRKTSERAATMVEYALLAALLCITMIGAMRAFSIAIDDKFEDIGDGVEGRAVQPGQYTDL